MRGPCALHSDTPRTSSPGRASTAPASRDPTHARGPRCASAQPVEEWMASTKHPSGSTTGDALEAPGRPDTAVHVAVAHVAVPNVPIRPVVVDEVAARVQKPGVVIGDRSAGPVVDETRASLSLRIRAVRASRLLTPTTPVSSSVVAPLGLSVNDPRIIQDARRARRTSLRLCLGGRAVL